MTPLTKAQHQIGLLVGFIDVKCLHVVVEEKRHAADSSKDDQADAEHELRGTFKRHDFHLADGRYSYFLPERRVGRKVGLSDTDKSVSV